MANGLDGLFSSTLKGLHEMIDVNTVIGSPIETSGALPLSRLQRFRSDLEWAALTGRRKLKIKAC